jgi:alginate O-acetyltransferase complex protein AlgJ
MVRRELAEDGRTDAAAARHLEQAVEITHLGDVAAMVQPLVRSRLCRGVHAAIRSAAEELGLHGLAGIWDTERREVFPRETVTIRRVLDALGNPWRPDSSADVLLLGDSFSNVYSSGEMGWGDSAGLPERLSFHLRRDVDAIIRNDAGAHATRKLLADELRAGRDRLAGKRIVIWQFAIRELAVGDWKRIEMKLGRARTKPAATQASRPGAPITHVLELPPGRTAVITGRVAALKRSPQPGTVPYKDHIMPVHLVEVRDAAGTLRGAEAVVLLWGLRDNQCTHATKLNLGQEITVRIRPWADVADRYGTINRGELDDVDIDVDVFWCEELR